MSIIYSTLTSIINRISDEFHKSFLFTTIFTILDFIENQWVNSFFKKLYPSENFLSFLNKNNILKNHIFNPLIVIFLFAGFLILSLNTPSQSLTITLLIAFIAFFIGSAILPRHFLNDECENIMPFQRKAFAPQRKTETGEKNPERPDGFPHNIFTIIFLCPARPAPEAEHQ